MKKVLIIYFYQITKMISQKNDAFTYCKHNIAEMGYKFGLSMYFIYYIVLINHC